MLYDLFFTWSSLNGSWYSYRIMSSQIRESNSCCLQYRHGIKTLVSNISVSSLCWWCWCSKLDFFFSSANTEHSSCLCKCHHLEMFLKEKHWRHRKTPHFRPDNDIDLFETEQTAVKCRTELGILTYYKALAAECTYVVVVVSTWHRPSGYPKSALSVSEAPGCYYRLRYDIPIKVSRNSGQIIKICCNYLLKRFRILLWHYFSVLSSFFFLQFWWNFNWFGHQK